MAPASDVTDDWEAELSDAMSFDIQTCAIMSQSSLAKAGSRIPQKLNHGIRTAELTKHMRQKQTDNKRAREKATDKARIKQLEEERDKIVCISGRAAKSIGMKIRKIDVANLTKMRAEALILAVFQPKPTGTIGINLDRIYAFLHIHLKLREQSSLKNLLRAIADFRRACPGGNLAFFAYDVQWDGTEQKMSGNQVHTVKMNITTRAEVLVIGVRLYIALMPDGSDDIHEVEDSAMQIQDRLYIYVKHRASPEILWI
jgi:hypothetical protein